jgi:predicted ATP-dependent endonuclease of OLD family
MTIIKAIEIENFRSIKKLKYFPSPGVNCIVGPGDSGKSSLLDAIDLCLGAKRSLQFSDSDFYYLDVKNPIKITITLGNLDDGLKNIDSYGGYLHNFNQKSKLISEEPQAGNETVLIAELLVQDDLEPQWRLLPNNDEANNSIRYLSWSDRARIAPTRLGTRPENNLNWNKNSILNKLSSERADPTSILVQAARDARVSYGETAKDQLSETLKIVFDTANSLGITVGKEVKPLLDALATFSTTGAISLHDENGIPLKQLGLGSARLLIAGLQKHLALSSSVILVDELEYGLEPHRIIRLLGALGSKDKPPLLQTFMTTHSPVAIRELSGDQIYILRKQPNEHILINTSVSDGFQGTIRKFPEALLSKALIICEGPSEIGLLRGLDNYYSSNEDHYIHLSAHGICLVDGKGDQMFERALAFKLLGYKTLVFKDKDKDLAPEKEEEFKNLGGQVISWRDARALEDELFLCLSAPAIQKLIELAIFIKGEATIMEHIQSTSSGKISLEMIRIQLLSGTLHEDLRMILGKASKNKRNGWFKTLREMEYVADKIVGPDLINSDQSFYRILSEIFQWSSDVNS